MKLSPETLKQIEKIEQGRAIARGIAEQQAQKEMNMARAAKRQETMLANAAKKVFTNAS